MTTSPFSKSLLNKVTSLTGSTDTTSAFSSLKKNTSELESNSNTDKKNKVIDTSDLTNNLLGE